MVKKKKKIKMILSRHWVYFRANLLHVHIGHF